MKLSEYAKSKSITYRSAYRHWKLGLIKGEQLSTGTIVVYNQDKVDIENPGEETELSCNQNDPEQDFIFIMRYFLSKLYGIKTGKNQIRKIIKQLKEDNEKV